METKCRRLLGYNHWRSSHSKPIQGWEFTEPNAIIFAPHTLSTRPPPPPPFIWASQVVLVVKNPPANAGDARDSGSIPGSGRSPGRGNGNPLQYSCQENGQRHLAGYCPWGRKSRTRLRDWTTNISFYIKLHQDLGVSGLLKVPKGSATFAKYSGEPPKLGTQRSSRKPAQSWRTGTCDWLGAGLPDISKTQQQWEGEGLGENRRKTRVPFG